MGSSGAWRHDSPAHSHLELTPSNTATSSTSSKSSPWSQTRYPPWKYALSSPASRAWPGDASCETRALVGGARWQNTIPCSLPRPASTAVSAAESPPSTRPPWSKTTSPSVSRMRLMMSCVSAADLASRALGCVFGGLATSVTSSRSFTMVFSVVLGRFCAMGSTAGASGPEAAGASGDGANHDSTA